MLLLVDKWNNKKYMQFIMYYPVHKFSALKTIWIILQKMRLITVYKIHLLKLALKFNLPITLTDKYSSLLTSNKLCGFQNLRDFGRTCEDKTLNSIISKDCFQRFCNNNV